MEQQATRLLANLKMSQGVEALNPREAPTNYTLYNFFLTSDIYITAVPHTFLLRLIIHTETDATVTYLAFYLIVRTDWMTFNYLFN